MHAQMFQILRTSVKCVNYFYWNFDQGVKCLLKNSKSVWRYKTIWNQFEDIKQYLNEFPRSGTTHAQYLLMYLNKFEQQQSNYMKLTN